jgi:hypothetical protein
MESVKQTSGDTENFVDWSQLKVRKIDKIRKLVGNVTYHVPLDNSYFATTNIYKKQGGEYRLMPYTLPKKGLCDFMNSEKFFVESLVKNSSFPYPFPCPFPQGVYFIYGFQLIFGETFTMIQNGQYAVQLNVEKDHKQMFGFRIFVNVIKM